MTQRRAKRGTTTAFTVPQPLRYLRPPHSLTIQLGLQSWKTMRVVATIEERGRFRTTSSKSVELDLEGRLPAEVHAELGRVVEDFVTSEWIERISRTF